MISKKLNDKINIKLIKNSDLFDKKYYLMENPKIKMNAAKHYYYHGYKENKSPSYNFSTEAYLKLYKDIEKNGINPLVHYLKHGKYENRKIFKDNGCSISELYYKIYNYYYNYNFYNIDINNKQFNFFVDDENELDLVFFSKIINFCKKEKLLLRIIYRKYDISLIKNFLKENIINVEFIYLTNNDYIFIGNNDYIICNGLKTAFTLLNSNIDDKRIFVYLNDYIENNDNIFLLMLLYNSGKLVFTTDNDKLLNNIFLHKINFELKKKFKSRKIYYSCEDVFIIGVLLLNNLFLDAKYDSKKYTIYSINNKIKYHLDTDVVLYNYQCQNKNKFDCLFYLADNDYEEPNVIAKFNKTNDKLCFVKLTSSDLCEINSIKSSSVNKYNVYNEFNNVMISARNEE